MISDRPTAGRIAAAAAAGAVFAAIVILIASGGHTAKMVFGDGHVYRNVASDITAHDPAVQRLISPLGTSLRYGRIGLPAMLWIASAGQRDAMPYAQPAIMVVSAAAIAAATARLLRQTSPLVSLAPFVAVGLTVALTGGFGEPVAIAAAMWGVVWCREGRPWLAATALGFAVLTRESAAAVLVGLVVWALLTARRRQALILTASLVPVAAWYGYVAARFGHLPFLDPWSATVSESVGPPIVAVVRSIGRLESGPLFVLALHIGFALYAFTRWRSSDLNAVAAACGLSVLVLGYDVWRFIGDATRVSSLLEVFVVLAVAQRLFTADTARAEAGSSDRRTLENTGTRQDETRTPDAASGSVGGSSPR